MEFHGFGLWSGTNLLSYSIGILCSICVVEQQRYFIKCSFCSVLSLFVTCKDMLVLEVLASGFSLLSNSCTVYFQDLSTILKAPISCSKLLWCILDNYCNFIKLEFWFMYFIITSVLLDGSLIVIWINLRQLPCWFVLILRLIWWFWLVIQWKYSGWQVLYQSLFFS